MASTNSTNSTTAKTVRALGRLLTGSAYVILGSDAARTPGGRVDQAAPTLDAIRSVVPLPLSDETAVRANGALQTVAGATLSCGIFPRLSATALAASLVPTTLAGHGFWSVKDPGARKAQRTQFMKNAAMLGGLLTTIALDNNAKEHR